MTSEEEPGPSTDEIVENDSEEDVEEEEEATTKNKKPGIIYLSTIPPRMNVQLLREALAPFGEIGRVYLQAEDSMQLYFHLFFYVHHLTI